MPAPLSATADRWIDDWLDRLTPARKIAHCLLVLPAVGPDGLPDAATRSALELGVGTLHSVRDLPASTATAYHERVAGICADAGLPPALISGNLEAGIMYSLGRSGTHFPYPRGIGISGDPDLAYRVAAATAIEARAVGFHWTFSPCIDVVSVPDDPILGVRAYGVPAAATGELGAAQIRGYQENGVLATAKHYPGHGDSSVDSHLAQPVVNRTPADHESIHLPPFADAVAADVASIMVAHIAYPALGIDVPASLSPTVNRSWLRQDLGYDGIIITDALHMDAVARHHTPAAAALLALQAGADVANVKCTPDEIAPIINHLVEALRHGALTESALNASVRRLLVARTHLNLHLPQPPLPSLPNIPTPWTDPHRASTVDLHTNRSAVGLGESLVVVGDSQLARRFAELGVQRGLSIRLAAEPLTPGVLDRVAAHHPGAQLIPIFGPGPIPAAQQWKDVAAAITHPCPAVIVNSTLPAQTFGDVADRVISVPAMDAFEIVTDAAVHAALDVLC
ncbi:glycoside hydrolase family 3 N-terminal domain-containing protein [Kribbella sp. NPDC005582]|uniref:glycoside hydrolase family 3 N-terminal domain-containing protein n=1 Tax=Kribbella sp. NPDC005582 TaxID=3156893 RepID=UPI0033B944FB